MWFAMEDAVVNYEHVVPSSHDYYNLYPREYGTHYAMYGIPNFNWLAYNNSGQPFIYDGCCAESPVENPPINDERVVPSSHDYYNLHPRGYGNLYSMYGYPYYNWPANVNNPLPHHYFANFGDGSYVENPGQFVFAYPGYYRCPYNSQEYFPQPEVLREGQPQRVPFYSTPPSRNSATPRVSPDSSASKEQRSAENSQDEYAFSSTEPSTSSPETGPTNSSTSPTSGSSSDSFVGPMATVYGTISVYLRHQIRVDLTIDKAIRLVNYATGAVVATNNEGSNICLIHANGKALLENETVHLKCKDIMAKITKRGVLFTALKNSLIYRVDASGTKSTTERFKHMDRDVSVDLFYTGSTHGPEVVEDCVSILKRHFHRSYPEGEEVLERLSKRERRRAIALDVRV